MEAYRVACGNQGVEDCSMVHGSLIMTLEARPVYPPS
jgi:hypothetical protein